MYKLEATPIRNQWINSSNTNQECVHFDRKPDKKPKKYCK